MDSITTVVETDSKLMVKQDTRALELVKAPAPRPVWATTSTVQTLMRAFKLEKIAQLEKKATETHNCLLIKHGDSTLHDQQGSPKEKKTNKKRRRTEKNKRKASTHEHAHTHTRGTHAHTRGTHAHTHATKGA
jgi:hypothetical protein